MTKHDPIGRDLRRESRAAAHLLESIGHEDDGDLRADMVEGETDLGEAIDAAIEAIEDCEVIIEGCAAREAALKDRREQAKRRLETIRGLIEQALLMAEVPTMRRPCATVTVKDVAPKVIVTDEAAIPSKYWKAQDPRLDLSAIKADEGAGVTIPGVSKTNGGHSLTVRRK